MGHGTMANDEVLKLSDKEMQLLGRFYDGECSFLEKGRARKLLLRNTAASAYLKSLEDITAETRRVATEDAVPVADLWNRIEARIEQEERAELFLGARRGEHEAPRSLFREFSWGATGALAAACVVLLVVQTGVLPTDSAAPGLGDSVAKSDLPQPTEATRAPVNFVSTANEPRRAVSSSGMVPGQIIGGDGISRGSYRGFEVDWMRSDGRVSVIQGPNNRSAVIWVRRRIRRVPSVTIERRAVQPAERAEVPEGLVPGQGAVPTAFPVGGE